MDEIAAAERLKLVAYPGPSDAEDVRLLARYVLALPRPDPAKALALVQEIMGQAGLIERKWTRKHINETQALRLSDEAAKHFTARILALFSPPQPARVRASFNRAIESD